MTLREHLREWREERRASRECRANLRRVIAMLEAALRPGIDPR